MKKGRGVSGSANCWGASPCFLCVLQLVIVLHGWGGIWGGTFDESGGFESEGCHHICYSAQSDLFGNADCL